MEPIPETAQADDAYGPFLLDDQDLLPLLGDLGRRLTTLVPDCVALSISLIRSGVTFTVASIGARALSLDGVQYSDAGPCLNAMDLDETVAWSVDDVEERWHLFSLAAAAVGVASTLSSDRARGCGPRRVQSLRQHPSCLRRTPRDHRGLAQRLALKRTTDANLGFSTLTAARAAPQVLRDATRMSMAAALLARLSDALVAAANERMHRAASQAGISSRELVDGVRAAMERGA